MNIGDRVRVTSLTPSDEKTTDLKVGDTGFIVHLDADKDDIAYVKIDRDFIHAGVNWNKELNAYCFYKSQLEVIEESKTESVYEDCDTVIKIKSSRVIDSISIYFKEDKQC